MKRLIPTTAITLLAAILWIACHPAAAQAPANILILPFDINAPAEFAYLQEGIYDMLTSRLAAIPEAEVIDRDAVDAALENRSGPMTPADAATLGETLEADYVVSGSFTMFGDSISTDAQFYDLNEKAARVNFNQTGQSPGDLIAHVDQFSDKIKSAVFGLPVAARPPQAPAASAQPAAPAVAPTTPAPAPVPAPAPAPSGVQSGLSPDPVPEVPFALTQSRRLKTGIKGLAVADVNNDQINEVVLVDSDILYVYQYQEKRFRQVNEIEAGRAHQHLGVDAADINQNGVAEIFVTSALPNIYGLNSYVLEWDDDRFSPVQEDTGWYFRVTRSADNKDMLLAQQRSDRAVLLNTKYELAWKEGEYKAARTLSVPDSLTIFGLAFGDILQDGKTETIAFTANDRLVIYDADSREIWSSSAPYGGSETYLEAEDPEKGKMGEYKFTKRVYFSQRILLADIDNNGTQEVIVVNNAGGRALEKTRMFKKGVIECLAWDGSGLTPKWKTREFEGYLSDCAIGDLDNDGADELVFVLVQKKGTLMKSERSTIFMMELQ